jgi:cytochrome-b5 reductase
MIAGGTGITPMLQVITHALVLDSKDKTTTVSLLYANQTEADILVRGELEALEKAYPDRFKLHYTVDKAPAKWKYSEGFIDVRSPTPLAAPPRPPRANPYAQEPRLKKHRKGPGEGVQVLICGPPPMIKFACLPNLEKLGFKEDNIFVF